MKFDSYDDYKYFILGASISSGRIFWSGEYGSNKGIKAEDVNIDYNISKDGNILTMKHYSKIE